jgi:hypothetical protein
MLLLPLQQEQQQHDSGNSVGKCPLAPGTLLPPGMVVNQNLN